MSKEKYPLVHGEKIRKYFDSYVIQFPSRVNKRYGHTLESSCFYKVKHPLPVFKKVQRFGVGVIANLIIPVGAIIYAPDVAFMVASSNVHERKLRASKAYVHSLAYTDSCPLGAAYPYRAAFSTFNASFKYVTDTIVKPDKKFDMNKQTCASGIHFFLNVQDALDWRC